MFDSHSHLTIEPVNSNILRHLQEFKDLGGKNILNVSTDIQSITDVISQSITFENSFPNLLQTGIGIHPETVLEADFNILNSINFLEQTLETHRNRVNAIGECGLDYYQFDYDLTLSPLQIEELKETQRNLFRKHVEIAIKNNLPLSIHTRDSKENNKCTADCLKIITSAGKGNAKGVFHSYTGSLDFLNEVLSLGFYVGFNGIITYPKAENVREILKMTPMNRVLVETDTPLLPPQNVRNGKSGDAKYGKPIDVLEIAQMISKVKNIPKEKVWEQLNDNYSTLFLSN
jgi:TatD DNase family protein